MKRKRKGGCGSIYPTPNPTKEKGQQEAASDKVRSKQSTEGEEE